jgi:hypothetical protein
MKTLMIDPKQISEGLKALAAVAEFGLRLKDIDDRQNFIKKLSLSAVLGGAAGALGLLVGSSALVSELILPLAKVNVLSSALPFLASIPILGLAAECGGFAYGCYQLYKTVNRANNSLEHMTDEQLHEHRKKILIDLALSLAIIVAMSMALAMFANPITGPLLSGVVLSVAAVKIGIEIYRNREAIGRFLYKGLNQLLPRSMKNLFSKDINNQPAHHNTNVIDMRDDPQKMFNSSFTDHSAIIQAAEKINEGNKVSPASVHHQKTHLDGHSAEHAVQENQEATNKNHQHVHPKSTDH